MSLANALQKTRGNKIRNVWRNSYQKSSWDNCPENWRKWESGRRKSCRKRGCARGGVIKLPGETYLENCRKRDGWRAGWRPAADLAAKMAGDLGPLAGESCWRVSAKGNTTNSRPTGFCLVSELGTLTAELAQPHPACLPHLFTFRLRRLSTRRPSSVADVVPESLE